MSQRRRKKAKTSVLETETDVSSVSGTSVTSNESNPNQLSTQEHILLTQIHVLCSQINSQFIKVQADIKELKEHADQLDTKIVRMEHIISTTPTMSISPSKALNANDVVKIHL